MYFNRRGAYAQSEEKNYGKWHLLIVNSSKLSSENEDDDITKWNSWEALFTAWNNLS